MNEQPLADRRVLVTRPVGQQQELIEAIETRGGEAISLPLLAIESIEDPRAEVRLGQNLARLPSYDLLIFVSVNAVRFGARRIARCGALIAPRAQVLAAGEATAREAAALLGRPATGPGAGGGSERLLAMPQLANVAGRSIAIFRGESGRELLATELRRRGALVDYCEVYRRAPAADAAARLKQILAHGAPDIVVVTSAEALARWRELPGEIALRGEHRSPEVAASATSAKNRSIALPLRAHEGAGQLLEIPVAVPSRRVAELAARYGFATVIDTGDAGTAVIVEALVERLRRRKT